MTTLSAEPSARSYPVLNIDLYSPEILADPWPALARIREAGPIVWNEHGYWMTGHDRVCRQIMNRPGAIGQEGMISTFFGEEAFISIDEKQRHNALRNVWAGAFSREAVAALASFVRTIANRMLDAVEPALRAGERIEMMAALCRPLPAYVIAHMMGVAEDQIPHVIEWSDRMSEATAGGFPIDYDNDPYWLASEKAKRDLAAYLLEQLDFRRKSPGDDIISQLVNSEIGKTLSDEAMIVNIRQLLFAGNETTAKWLGHILHIFGDRPDIRAEVDRNRKLLPRASEEVMRWQGVTQVLPRGINAKHTIVEGVEPPLGSELLLLLGAANRDEARYDHPDVLDIHRESKPHLGFGFGLHSCLGAVLARMEALQVATLVLDRLPAYRIAVPVTYGSFSLRGPSELWLEPA